MDSKTFITVRSSLGLNCYRYYSSLVLQNGNGAVSFLYSSEGVEQGNPLDMIAYVIGILPLINNLKREIPDFTQPWYDDGDRSLGTLTKIESYFK